MRGRRWEVGGGRSVHLSEHVGRQLYEGEWAAHA